MNEKQKVDFRYVPLYILANFFNILFAMMKITSRYSLYQEMFSWKRACESVTDKMGGLNSAYTRQSFSKSFRKAED